MGALKVGDVAELLETLGVGDEISLRVGDAAELLETLGVGNQAGKLEPGRSPQTLMEGDAVMMYSFVYKLVVLLLMVGDGGLTMGFPGVLVVWLPDAGTGVFFWSPRRGGRRRGNVPRCFATSGCRWSNPFWGRVSVVVCLSL